MGKTTKASGPGFNVHPFIRNNPEAVFIYLTDVKSKRDTDDIREAGYKLAKELIVKTPTEGYPNSTRVNVKPNWTSAGPKVSRP